MNKNLAPSEGTPTLMEGVPSPGGIGSRILVVALLIGGAVTTLELVSRTDLWWIAGPLTGTVGVGVALWRFPIMRRRRTNLLGCLGFTAVLWWTALSFPVLPTIA